MEINLNTRFMVLVEPEERIRGAIVNGLKALLFGRPPSRRQTSTETEITAPVSNGVLHLLTEDGKLYVIGRDFLQGETEKVSTNYI